MKLPGAPKDGVSVSALMADGRVLLRGLFKPLATEFVEGREISIVAESEDGRRVTIGIPFELLQDVGPADTTEPELHGRARMSVVGKAP
jgi:hypothetical protein